MDKNIVKLFDQMMPPCPKCPYQLGQVQFATSPCPSCKLNHYQTYHTLIKNRTPNSD